MNNNSTDNGLTVVIPVRNRENLIIRCLDSVKRQTLRPLNVIVVDNGSTTAHGKPLKAGSPGMPSRNLPYPSYPNPDRVRQEPETGDCRRPTRNT